MEQKIEMEGVKKSLGKIEKKLEILTYLLRANLLKSPMPNRQNSACPICFSDEHFQGECQEGEAEEVQALNFMSQPWSGQKGHQNSSQQGQPSSFKRRVPYHQGYHGRPPQAQQPNQQPYQHPQEGFQQGKVNNFQFGKMKEFEEQNKRLEMWIKMMEAQERMMVESQERTNKFLEDL